MWTSFNWRNDGSSGSFRTLSVAFREPEGPSESKKMTTTTNGVMANGIVKPCQMRRLPDAVRMCNSAVSRLSWIVLAVSGVICERTISRNNEFTRLRSGGDTFYDMSSCTETWMVDRGEGPPVCDAFEKKQIGSGHNTPRLLLALQRPRDAVLKAYSHPSFVAANLITEYYDKIDYVLRTMFYWNYASKLSGLLKVYRRS